MSFSPETLYKWIRARRDRKSVPPKAAQVSILPGRHRGFRYFLLALLAISVSAACIENGLHPLVLLLLPVVMSALLRSDYGRPYIWPERTTLAVFVAYVVLFCAGVILLHGRLTLPKFMVYFTFGIVMVRVLSPLTDRNISQLIALSPGLILINCILTNHIVFGLVLPVYFFVLMGTLLLFHLARNAPPSGESIELPRAERFTGTWYGRLTVYTLWMLAFTAVIFVFVPRPFFVIPGLRTAMAHAGGLAELEKRITYRDMTGMAGRNRIAFKVKIVQGKLPDAPYWRGRVLEKYEDGTWTSSEQLRGMGRIVRADPDSTLDFRFVPYRLQSKIVYVSGLPVEALGRRDQPLYITSAAEVIVDSPFLFADSYFVSTVDRPIPSSFRRNPSYLDRTGVTPRVEKLALDWTGRHSSPRDKASAVIRRLRSGFRYALAPPVAPEGTHPLEFFLFESKTGNCEQFSGALCLMLRAVGIPSRVVEGFSGVEPTDVPDEYIVRFARAHAWVEALVNDKYWTSLDAVPAVGEGAHSRVWRFLVDVYDALEYQWIKQVVYFDRSDQANAMRALRKLMSGDLSPLKRLTAKIGPAAVPTLVAAGLLLAGLLARYALRQRKKDWSAVYVKTMKQLVSAGILTTVHPWHERNTAEIMERCPGSSEAVLRFMTTYLKGRFGFGKDVSQDDLERAGRDLLHSIRGGSG
ncbi:MAG: transglutaminaseTgpA domain-containing protein [Pseudomonadota bacterium]